MNSTTPSGKSTGKKDNSPLSPREVAEKKFSEKHHEILPININFDGGVSIVSWNVKSAAVWVRAQDHKDIIGCLHQELKSDIFCIQESLWVSKSFCRHTMREENTSNFRCIGNKEASILYNACNVTVKDISSSITLS